ncbi:5-bromo-4-chloroindolyl phosphate hydrolysis family protein [Peptoniphilus sp.]|jgi:5-bromo-4-chloroindolyl phosphate hydrolysis protein|uniref:5-bromo-4-chloroindolyl phosphate hydrolysis family protein n=1 Tax=Peptoniphilus sp. TaxID=1971214 RepID=UPI003D8B06C1
MTNYDDKDKFDRLIDKAIQEENFKQLNSFIEDISDGVEQAVNLTKKSINNFMNKKDANLPYSVQNDDKIINQNPKSIKRVKNWDRALKFSIVFHAIMLFALLLDAFDYGFSGLIFHYLPLFIFWIIPALVASAYGLYRNKKTKEQIIRFRKYTREIGNNTVIPVTDLAVVTAKPVEFTINDLLDLINKDFFRQARIVENGKLFILDSKTYQLYKKELMNAEISEITGDDDTNFEENREKADVLLREAKVYIKELTEICEKIDEPMKSKIANLLKTVTKIFGVVKENPKVSENIKKAVDYYLPITVKISNNYLEMKGLSTSSVSSSLREIENTMDTILVAFNKLLDNLYQDKMLDLSSDISVLKTMLRQEGLLDDDDFKIGR